MEEGKGALVSNVCTFQSFYLGAKSSSLPIVPIKSIFGAIYKANLASSRAPNSELSQE